MDPQLRVGGILSTTPHGSWAVCRHLGRQVPVLSSQPQSPHQHKEKPSRPGKHRLIAQHDPQARQARIYNVGKMSRQQLRSFLCTLTSNDQLHRLSYTHPTPLICTPQQPVRRYLTADTCTMRLQTFSSTRVQLALTCACNNPARLPSVVARLGCSGPRTFSRIA